MWLSRNDDPNQAPNQNCVFCVIVGNLKFISNQISLWSGRLLIGKVAGTPKKALWRNPGSDLQQISKSPGPNIWARTENVLCSLSLLVCPVSWWVLWATVSSWVGTALRLVALVLVLLLARSWIKHCLNCCYCYTTVNLRLHCANAFSLKPLLIAQTLPNPFRPQPNQNNLAGSAQSALLKWAQLTEMLTQTADHNFGWSTSQRKSRKIRMPQQINV